MLSADAYVIYANEERAMVAIILHDIGMCREGSSIVVVDYACVGFDYTSGCLCYMFT